MKKIFLLFLLNLLTEQSWGQGWTKTQLNNVVSINFPSVPEIYEVGNKKIYQITNLNYIINVVKVDMSINPNFNIKPNELTDFYQGVVNGRLDGALDSKLLNEKKVTFETFEGIEIVYTKDFNGVDNLLVTSRLVLVAKELFIFDIWDLLKNGQKKLTKKFFKSIELK